MNEREVPPRILEMAKAVGEGFDMDQETKASRAARVKALKLQESVIDKREAAWDRFIAPHRGAAGGLRDVGPDEPCDRCGHASRYHAAPPDSHCKIADAPRVAGVKTKLCWCDGFFPKP